jgi:hypothetical protein
VVGVARNKVLSWHTIPRETWVKILSLLNYVVEAQKRSRGSSATQLKHEGPPEDPRIRVHAPPWAKSMYPERSRPVTAVLQMWAAHRRSAEHVPQFVEAVVKVWFYH